MITDFPHGVSSFGAPVAPGANLIHNGMGVANGGASVRPNRHFYVHGNLGGDGNVGTSPDRPFRTMAAAFAQIGSGDVIHFQGNTTEQLSTPTGVFDVTIIGEGNVPRHSDQHTTNNGYSSATWKAGASASTPNLIVRQQGWRIMNILWDGPASAAAIQVLRDGGAGDAERDGSHVHIRGNKFVAAQNHINFSGGPSQCVIEDNLFFGSTGYSMLEVTGAGIGTNNFFTIRGNRWINNAGHIDAALNYGMIIGNSFGVSSDVHITLSGGSNNSVHGNYLAGDYDAYVPGTSDDWAGNFSMDIASAEVGDNGITTDVPTA